ncbi:MAG: hypothetical protein IPO94_13960, partial [Saprospiraceae bacterium]|nr:hypothetical protein [Saprospiraceae bacterium]
MQQNNILTLIIAIFCSISTYAQPYINGPIKTGVTSASGVSNPVAGYQWSEVSYDAPNLTYSSTSAGYNGSKLAGTTGFRLADDFTIADLPVGVKWNITSLEFLAYQTGYTGAVSPFNEVYVQIWNGDPRVAGSTVVFGDLTTNRFASSSEIQAHRTFNSVAPSPGTTPGTTRRIWKIVANA